MYVKVWKRFFDIILSAAGLILFSIPMIIIAIAVKLDSPGPAIFKQKRLGKYGKVYTMYKFRSMCVGAEKSGVYSNNQDSRVSRVGSILRKTSLDELPQLWNVFKGDCSLVGFRSPLTYHPWSWEEYTDEERKMFNLRPGITGWAQVNGRKTVEWHERIAMNVWYAENCSIFLDIKILLMTIYKVINNADNENIGKTIDK
ncbi:Undecaprenyl phosphate N,N'-diacetylbacillosamine 1-phosphate transferase [Clostridiales bacterium CHKCI006]|nr:Undecaprenyl phosphate N,N'-diacetylbacillosamine 1-phosphate transferase [Clostridiales bacterium CHKCI006]